MDWWRDRELVQPADVEILGDGRLDVLFTHDAPAGAEPTDTMLNDLQDEAIARRNGRLVLSVVERTQPDLVVHGHWHLRQSRSLAISGLDRPVRVEGLASNLDDHRSAWGVLSLPDLKFVDGSALAPRSS